jgi:hypothetical protein
MEKIVIRAFRAVDEPTTCVEFERQHADVLHAIGVDNVVKPDADWMEDPDTVVFIAEHADLGMVGGFRLQKDKDGRPLPMERALKALDPGVSGALARLRDEGNAEMTALWNAHRFAGRGVPMLLMSAMVAAAHQLPLRHLSILVAEYMGTYAARNGCARMPIGSNGEFTYPVPGIRSYAMAIEDLDVLPLARMEDRHRILSLRMRPEQVRIEKPKALPLEVHYRLLLNIAAAENPQLRQLRDRDRFAA